MDIAPRVRRGNFPFRRGNFRLVRRDFRAYRRGMSVICWGNTQGPAFALALYIPLDILDMATMDAVRILTASIMSVTRRVNWKIAPINFAFLTYSQAPDDFESAIEGHLRGLGVTDIIIGHERHADGGHHYHVMAQWPAGYETRDARAFDVDGYHPNYRNVRPGANAQRVYRYCCKDNQTTGNLELSAPVKPTRNEIWSEFIGATEPGEFFELLSKRAPYEYILNYDRLQSFARQVIAKPQAYVPKYTDFVVPGVLRDWVSDVSILVGVF